MATIRLIPSTYYLSNTKYLSVSDANNMYADTDSTDYATVTNSRNKTTAYYIYIRGFNFDDVPSNAVVNSITIKLKAYHSGGNTSTISCYNGTAPVSAAGSTTALGTSATVKTFTNTTIDWDTLKNYGNNFGIGINCRRANSNTTSYVYIYGAEILVDVTVPTHDISIVNNSANVTTELSSSQSVIEGTDHSIYFYGIESLDNVDIKDNNADIESNLICYAAGTTNLSFIPSKLIDSNGTVTNPNNGLADHTSADYAQTNGQSTHFLLYKFDVPKTPSTVTNVTVSCMAKVAHTCSNGTFGQVQLYSGDSSKGNISTFGSTVQTVNLNTGNWTLEEIEDVRIRIGNNYTGGTTRYYTCFYGATLTISYTIENDVYVYVIDKIVTDHNIVINDVALQQSVYRKVNSAWSKYSKIYVKQNNVWVEQSDFEAVLQSNKIYVNK